MRTSVLSMASLSGLSIWRCHELWCKSRLLFFCNVIFFLFRAAPKACGSSQARGRIRAAAAGLHHSPSNTRYKGHLWSMLHLHQCWILNPLSEAGGGTCILMDASQVRFRWATMGTPRLDVTRCILIQVLTHEIPPFLAVEFHVLALLRFTFLCISFSI